jgi:hypothetical protein
VDDQNAEPIAQIDAELERLRQARTQDEADPKCAEIDANITALQFMRDKVIHASGGGTLQSMGEHGELLDVQSLRKQWEKNKTYCVAPQGVQTTLHLLLYAARYNTKSPEDTQECLAKISEVLEAVWPTSTSRKVTIVKHGHVQIIVPTA